MRKSMLAKTILIFGVVALCANAQQAMGQGSGSSRTQSQQGSGTSRTQQQQAGSSASRGSQSVPESRRPPTTAQFAATFWNFLNNPKTPYKKWGSPGKADFQGPREVPKGVATPHGNVGQSFVNNIANRDLKGLPMNSVFAREEYADDGKTLRFISVMYRSKGFDPKHSDWYYLLYNPDGSLVKTRTAQGEKMVAGRVQSCIDCHQKAKGNDFVFSNIRLTKEAAPKPPAGSGSSR